MEIWFKTDSKQIRLPVLPSEVMLNGSNILTSANVLRLGEVTIYSGNNTQDGEISSFFPNHEYSFNQYKNVEKPFDLATQFRTWRDLGQVVRMVITPNINFRVRITNFEYGEKDGTGDIYYSLKWKEIRDVKIKKLNTNNNSNNNNNSKPNNATEDKTEGNKQKTHIVKKGDCLWDIAQKHYGKGSDYPKIKNANTSKYPSLKKNNIIYVGWQLVIP
jgi:nucleoid-associated protein YgaU